MKKFIFQFSGQSHPGEVELLKYALERLREFSDLTVHERSNISAVFVAGLEVNKALKVDGLTFEIADKFSGDLARFAARHQQTIVFGEEVEGIARAITQLPELIQSRTEGVITIVAVGTDDLLQRRFAELKETAKDQGISWPEGSESDFLYWRAANNSVKSPLLYLAPNGNLIAEWRGKLNEGIMLEFRGNGDVLFALIPKQQNGHQSTCYGNNRQENIIKIVEVNDLGHLLYE